MTESNSLIGKQLGDYKLTAKLTSGGMAHIYMGVDVKLQRQAAVKILTPDMMGDDDILKTRFVREAQAVAALEHDHIITIYQYGEQDKIYFLAMKFVPGRDLAEELKMLRQAGKRMDIHRALDLLGQVASALDYAHSKGVVHRDIKPSNILIDASDRAYLTDFGLALRQSIDQTLGTAFGTPRYISPEQAMASERAVPQSDIYSLAVIMFEILTGEMIFKGATPMEIALSHISEPPPPLRSIDSSIPAGVEREVLKALDKAPEKRHKTATAFIEAVRRAYDAAESDVGSSTLAAPPEAPAKNVRSKAKSEESTAAKAEAVPDTKPEVEEQAPEPTPILSEQEVQKAAKAQRRRLFRREEKAKADSSMESRPKPEPAPLPAPPGRRIPLILGGFVIIALITGLAMVGPGPQIASEITQTPVATSAGENDSSATPGVAVGETSAAPTDVPATQDTVSGPEGQVTLLYNAEAFAMRNDSDFTLDVSTLSFARGGATFEGSQVTGGLLPASQCVVILLQRPGVTADKDWNCTSLRSQQYLPDTSALFWRNDGASTFDVLRDGSSFTTCNTVGRGQTDTCVFGWPDYKDS